MGIMNFIKKQKEIRKIKGSKEYKQAELRIMQKENMERKENNKLDMYIRKEKSERFKNNKAVQIGKNILNNFQSRTKNTKGKKAKGFGIYGGTNIYTQRSTGSSNIFTQTNKNNVYAGQGFKNPFTGKEQNPIKTKKKQKTITIKL